MTRLATIVSLASGCLVGRSEWVQMDVYAYGYRCPHCVNKRIPDGIGANGKPVKPGFTLAADPSIPFGTKVFVQGSWWTCADRGSKIRGNKLDLAVRTHREAKRFGVKRERVWIELTKPMLSLP